MNLPDQQAEVPRQETDTESYEADVAVVTRPAKEVEEVPEGHTLASATLSDNLQDQTIEKVVGSSKVDIGEVGIEAMYGESVGTSMTSVALKRCIASVWERV